MSKHICSTSLVPQRRLLLRRRGIIISLSAPKGDERNPKPRAQCVCISRCNYFNLHSTTGRNSSSSSMQKHKKIATSRAREPETRRARRKTKKKQKRSKQRSEPTTSDAMERENDGSTIIHKKEVNMLSLECTKEREIRNRNGGYSCWVWVTSSSVALECHKNNTQKKNVPTFKQGAQEEKKNRQSTKECRSFVRRGCVFRQLWLCCDPASPLNADLTFSHAKI